MFIDRLDNPENYWQFKHSMSFNENIYPEMFDYFSQRSINSAVIINVSGPKAQAYMTLYKMTVQ